MLAMIGINLLVKYLLTGKNYASIFFSKNSFIKKKDS